ncbi:MAG: protein disulfide oxidoreductase [Azonexus sp.]
MNNDSPRKKTGWRRWGIEALIFIAGMVALQLWQNRHAPSGPAPAITGQSIAGQPFDLAAWRAAHPGQPALIYFWAEWCAICKTTAGTVENVARDWPTVTLAIQSGDAAAVARIVQQRGHAWPITLADPQSEHFRHYGLQGVPAMAILDPAGNLRFVSQGYTSEIGLRLRLWWAGLN